MEGRKSKLNSPASSPTEPQHKPDQTVIEAHDSIEADEADPEFEDDGYETDQKSATSTSLSSSVRDYVFENNRRYHRYKEGRYLLPNDEPEMEREDMKHAVCVHVCDGQLHFAPLENPEKILDIGTGTGIWCIDMGDEYPAAEVIGIDLSPIQSNWVPPNVRFYVDDAEAEWSFAPESFDFIHARHICMAIKDWPRLLEQAYDTLKPGGWIELQELRLDTKCDDGTMPPDHAFTKFLHFLREGLLKFKVDLLGIDKNTERITDAGFINVEERVWKVPIGTWPRDQRLKDIGSYNRAVIWDGLQGVSMGAYTRGLKWTPAEVETFLISVRKSLMDKSVHGYYTFHSVYGQKPLDAD